MPNLGANEVVLSEDERSDLDIDEVPQNHAESYVEEDVDAKEQLKDDLNQQVEKTSGKQARKEEEEAVIDDTSMNGDKDSDQGDEEPNDGEYEVEGIVGHKFVRGTLLYEVRWKGYSESDDTFEPEENLLPDSRTILAKYHHSIGGQPKPETTQPKRTKSRSRRSEDAKNSSNSTPPPSKRQKRTSTTKQEKNSKPEEEEWGSWLPSESLHSWEDMVKDIDTVERDGNGNLRAFIQFKNGKKTKVSRNQYLRYCPRAMLKFYEAHLSV